MFTTRKYIYHDYTYHDGFRHRKPPFYHSYFIMKCGINIILRLLLWYFYYGNGKSNRGTVIVVKRVFSLAKTIVVDVFVIYIYTNTAVVFFVMGCMRTTIITGSFGIIYQM